MVRKTGRIACALLGIALLLEGCGNAQRDATEAAISATQAAINAVEGEAEKYAPDQLQAAQNALQTAKDAFAKEDYQAALAATRDAASRAKGLTTTAAAKKEELAKGWADLNTSIPKSLDGVKARLNAYSHSANLPAGLDKDKLADVKAQYDQLKQSWAEALAAATQGNLGDAVKKAAAVKDLLAKLKELLGIKS
jgi:DNA repair exonuclease SbcCD ATPase subunit